MELFSFLGDLKTKPRFLTSSSWANTLETVGVSEYKIQDHLMSHVENIKLRKLREMPSLAIREKRFLLFASFSSYTEVDFPDTSGVIICGAIISTQEFIEKSSVVSEIKYDTWLKNWLEEGCSIILEQLVHMIENSHQENGILSIEDSGDIEAITTFIDVFSRTAGNVILNQQAKESHALWLQSCHGNFSYDFLLIK